MLGPDMVARCLCGASPCICTMLIVHSPAPIGQTYHFRSNRLRSNTASRFIAIRNPSKITIAAEERSTNARSGASDHKDLYRHHRRRVQRAARDIDDKGDHADHQQRRGLAERMRHAENGAGQHAGHRQRHHVVKAVCTFDAPTPSSLANDGGTAFRAARLAMMMIGIVISDSTMPPTSGSSAEGRRS